MKSVILYNNIHEYKTIKSRIQKDKDPKKINVEKFLYLIELFTLPQILEIVL